MSFKDKENEKEGSYEITNIAVPLTTQVKFPDKCICCHAENPQNKYEYNTNIFSKLFGSIMGDSWIIKIPCCKNCVSAFHMKKIIPEIALLSLIMLFPLLAIYLHKSNSSPYLVFGLIPVLAVLFLWIIFKIQSRFKIIEIFIHNELAIYSFCDGARAKEFFELNNNIATISDGSKNTSSVREGINQKTSWKRISLLTGLALLVILIILSLVNIGKNNEIESAYQESYRQERINSLKKELAEIDEDKKEIWEVAHLVNDKGIPVAVRKSDESEKDFEERRNKIILKFALMDKSLLKVKGESEEDFKNRFNEYFERKKKYLLRKLSEFGG